MTGPTLTPRDTPSGKCKPSNIPSSPPAFCFAVRGIPKGQPRPRAFARKMGNKYVARVYEAGTAEAWKGAVIQAGRSHRPAHPLEGGVVVEITFYFARPKSMLRKKDPSDPIPHTTKPDIDNAAKAVLDALTQDGWWLDDAQVQELHVNKFYVAKGETPGAIIVVARA